MAAGDLATSPSRDLRAGSARTPAFGASSGKATALSESHFPIHQMKLISAALVTSWKHSRVWEQQQYFRLGLPWGSHWPEGGWEEGRKQSDTPNLLKSEPLEFATIQNHQLYPNAMF